MCENIDQLLGHQELNLKITELWERSKVVNLTKCLPPCHFTEYQLAREPVRLDTKGRSSNLHIILTSMEVVSKEERLIYTIQSFVAEFGGALGLFLSFSFIMVWDIFVFFTEIIKKSLARSRQLENYSYTK